MSLALLDTQLSTLLGRSPSATNVLPTDELRILQHFHAVTSRSMGSEATQKILHRNVLKRAWGHPYLMHMALAVATAHLRRLNVEDSVPRAGKQLSVVEAKHWQRALLLHREELSTANREYDARYDARVETTTCCSTPSPLSQHATGSEPYESSRARAAHLPPGCRS